MGNIPASAPEAPAQPKMPANYYNFAVEFLKANRQCTNMYWADRDAIPALIRSEMLHQPGLTITHHPDPGAFVDFVNERCRTGANLRQQCLVELDAKEGHCVGVDLRIDAGEPTVIVIESSNMNAKGPSFMLIRLLTAFESRLPGIAPNGLDRHLMFFETQAQQSPSDCAMFSLSACKAMFKEAAAFEALHKRLRAGEFREMLAKHYVACDEADLLLPSSLMKHTQSSTRLADHARRRMKDDPMQARRLGQSIRRQKGLTFARDQRTYSVSIEMARIKMAGRALTPPAEDKTLLAPPVRGDLTSSTESR